MTRHSSFRILSALTLAAAGLVFAGLARADDRPNIIVMMSDDMGLGDTSAYQDWTGNADAVQIATPNLERLARMGTRFTDAHAPSSRCTATRYALLTGRYSWRTRLKFSVLWPPQGDPLIEPDRPTLATILAAAGYRCGMSGKWHVGLTYRNADGDPADSWKTSDLRRGIAGSPLKGGGEDSLDLAELLLGHSQTGRQQLVHHDHKQGSGGGAKNPGCAWLALRWNHPASGAQRWPGQWKLFVDEGLLLRAEIKPRELYELGSDPREQRNRLDDPTLKPLVTLMTLRLEALVQTPDA